MYWATHCLVLGFFKFSNSYRRFLKLVQHDWVHPHQLLEFMLHELLRLISMADLMLHSLVYDTAIVPYHRDVVSVRLQVEAKCPIIPASPSWVCILGCRQPERCKTAEPNLRRILNLAARFKLKALLHGRPGCASTLLLRSMFSKFCGCSWYSTLNALLYKLSRNEFGCGQRYHLPQNEKTIRSCGHAFYCATHQKLAFPESMSSNRSSHGHSPRDQTSRAFPLSPSHHPQELCRQTHNVAIADSQKLRLLQPHHVFI